MRCFLALLATLFCFTTASAATPEDKLVKHFYDKPIDELWKVGGNTYTKSNATCYANATFKDGSTFEIVRDLVDGELYLRAENVNWSLAKGTDDADKLRINLYHGTTVTDGGLFSWIVLTKSTIVIPAIDIKTFISTLWKSDTIRFIMPGDTGNATVPLPKAKAIITALAECIKKFNVNDKAPDLSGAPAAATKTKVPGKDEL